MPSRFVLAACAALALPAAGLAQSPDAPPAPDAPRMITPTQQADAVGSASASAGADPVMREGYRLGAREKLFIRIGQWNSVETLYTSWPDVSGEYNIGADGMLSLPMAGAVMAEGRTTAELAEAILTQLQARVGMQGELDASVEVIEYRPIYVLGEVQAPGAIAYRPGMNALEAIGLAGGFRRADTAFLQSERSALSSLGNHEVLQLELHRRLATLARLTAELGSKDDLTTPPELEKMPGTAELMTRERQIKAARDAEVKSRLSQIASLERLLKEEVDRLNDQIELRKDQLELADEELANTQNLVERGLTVASRRLDLQSRVADQEVRLLELETARLASEQRLNEAGRDRLDILNARKKEILDSLRAEEGEIATLRARMKTESALYAEAVSKGEGFVTNQGIGAPVLELTRRDDNGLAQRAVERGEELLPGDIIEVRLPMPGETGGTSTAPVGAALPILGSIATR